MECDLNSPYPEIQNFGARVNGGAVEVTYDSHTTEVPPLDGQPGGSVDRHCWAFFPAAFAPGKDVTITVTYKVQGYYIDHGVLANYLRFTYILVTGAGWKDTIGTADIIARLPYAVNDQTILETSAGALLDKNEVRWHFENLEPESNISLTILNPQNWAAIQKEAQTVAANPQDGEAWGRLGKAYKEVWMFERGFRGGAAGEELLRKSTEAYQKAVSLLPKDADWHYGYADLVCWQAEWSFSEQEKLSNPQVLRTCIEQLMLALDLNPNYVKARERLTMLAENSNLGQNFLDLSGAKPNYLILTPGNYKTVTPYPSMTASPAPSPTPTRPQPTRARPTPSETASEPQVTDTIEPPAAAETLVSSTTEVQTAQPAPGKRGLPFCGSVIMPLLGVALAQFFKLKAGR
jgi:tetratricopeptide (TPR) repeat protein